jgi:hypothetical protein
MINGMACHLAQASIRDARAPAAPARRTLGSPGFQSIIVVELRANIARLPTQFRVLHGCPWAARSNSAAAVLGKFVLQLA